MTNLVTVITFNWLHDAAVPRSLLDSEGIDTFLKNENIASTISLYSMAVGGVELQVREEDQEKALAILKEKGFIKVTPASYTGIFNKGLNYYFHIIDNKPKRNSFIAISSMVIVAISILIYYQFKPDYTSILIEKVWCLDQMTYDGVEIQAYTFTTPYSVFCRNYLKLNENQIIHLPGFDSPSIKGKWKIEGKVLTVYDIDTLSVLYERKYLIDINADQLTLSHPQVVMKFRKYHDY